MSWRTERRGNTDREGLCRTTARSSARKSAKEKGVIFDLPNADCLPEIPDDCPLCGQAMEPGGKRNNSPSLDRILPGLGYVVENLWWVCHDCNRQKSDLDPARAYDLWDRVWEEIKARGLPLPNTRRRKHDERNQPQPESSLDPRRVVRP